MTGPYDLRALRLVPERIATDAALRETVECAAAEGQARRALLHPGFRDLAPPEPSPLARVGTVVLGMAPAGLAAALVLWVAGWWGAGLIGIALAGAVLRATWRAVRCA